MKSESKMLFPPVMIRSYEQLGNTIRRARKLQKLSQIALAKKAGVTQSTISNMELGKTTAEVGTLLVVFATLKLDLIVKSRPDEEKNNSLEGLF